MKKLGSNNWLVRINWSHARYLVSRLKWMLWPFVVLTLGYLYIEHFAYDISNVSVNSKLTLEYITVLRWPFVTLIALLMVYPHLEKIIDRMRRIGARGAYVELADPQPSPSTGGEIAELNKKNPEIDEPVVQGQQEEQDDPKMVELLSSQAAYDVYESLYKAIHGTQLEALKRLNDYPVEGLDDNDLNDLVQTHIIRSNNAGTPAYMSSKAFMNYLVRNQLALYDNDGKYKLTYFGKYFLIFLLNKDLLEADKVL